MTTTRQTESHTAEGIERLARSLHQHATGSADWIDDEHRDNYLHDAREIARRYPHLLTAHERSICDCHEPVPVPAPQPTASARTPYDTGERAEPIIWPHDGDPDRFGRVDFDSDDSTTIATVHVERTPSGDYALVYTAHDDALTVRPEHEPPALAAASGAEPGRVRVEWMTTVEEQHAAWIPRDELERALAADTLGDVLPDYEDEASLVSSAVLERDPAVDGERVTGAREDSER